MKVEGTFYRAHDPRWSWTPLSGDGAAVGGARWNSKGTPALYLASSPGGAINEVIRGLPGFIEPLTLCSYKVECEDICDLTDQNELAALGLDSHDFRTPWRSYLAAGETPPTWSISGLLIAQGRAGIRVQSYAKGAKPDHINLVLWKWGPDLPYKVDVYDPSGRLPKNQLSWG